MNACPVVLTLVLLPAFLEPAYAQPAAAQPAAAVTSTPAPTRLFLMPTGRMLEASSGYIDVISFGVAQFQAGGSEWFSMGAGTISYVFSGARPVWLTPKVAVAKTERASAAIGTVHYFAPGGSGGFGYGVVTIGSRARAVTVGFLQGYGDVPDSAHAVMVGFEAQRSSHTRLMMEATITRSGGLVIAGLRRSGKRFTSDFGMAVPFADDAPLVAFPIVNFGWKF